MKEVYITGKDIFGYDAAFGDRLPSNIELMDKINELIDVVNELKQTINERV
jgi:hypothetical protein